MHLIVAAITIGHHICERAIFSPLNYSAAIQFEMHITSFWRLAREESKETKEKL